MNAKKFTMVIFLISILVFSINTASAAEGDTKAEAKQALLGTNSGTIASDGGDFWFVFNASADKGYEIALTGPSGTDLDMEIQNGNNEYVSGAYSTSYPDTTEVGGYDLYYIRVYSFSGSGDFTLEISEILIGTSPNNRLQFQVGDNFFNSSNYSNQIFATLSNFTYGDYFQFELIPLTSNTYGDMWVYNGQDDTYGYNSSNYPDDSRLARMIGLDEPISIDLYFGGYNGNSYFEFNLRITETEAPRGISPLDAYELFVGESTNISLFPQAQIYANISFVDSDWYTFNFTGFDNAYVSIAFVDQYGYYFEWASIRLPGMIYVKHEAGPVLIRMESYDLDLNITITPTRDAPPEGYTRDNPILLEEGVQREATLAGDQTFMKSSTIEGQPYLLSIDFEGTESYDFEIHAFNDFSYYPYYYYYSNTAEYYFVGDGNDIEMVIYTWQDLTQVNFSVILEQVAPAAHSTMEDAKVASVGTNTGEVEYPGQQFYFVFTGEAGTFYEFSMYSNDGGWVYYDTYDENGNYINTYEGFVSNGDPIYIKVTAEGSKSFTLNVVEGEIPSDSSYFYYSDHFAKDDFLEYELSFLSNGEPIDEDYLADGDIIRVDILQNAPSLSQYDSVSSAFEITVNGEEGAFGDSVEPFILPVEIEYGNGDIISGLEIIENEFWGESVVEENGRYIISYEYSDSYGGDEYVERFEVIFDSTTHHLISYNVYNQYGDESYELSLDLTRSHISGPNSGDDDNQPPISLPFQSLYAMIAIGILPILRRRKI